MSFTPIFSQKYHDTTTLINNTQFQQLLNDTSKKPPFSTPLSEKLFNESPEVGHGVKAVKDLGDYVNTYKEKKQLHLFSIMNEQKTMENKMLLLKNQLDDPEHADQISLNIKVKSAKLKPSLSSADSFIMFQLNGHQQRSRVVTNSLTPSFNQDFNFFPQSLKDVLEVYLIDFDSRDKNELLGMVKILVSKWSNQEQNSEKWVLKDQYNDESTLDVDATLIYDRKKLIHLEMAQLQQQYRGKQEELLKLQEDLVQIQNLQNPATIVKQKESLFPDPFHYQGLFGILMWFIGMYFCLFLLGNEYKLLLDVFLIAVSVIQEFRNHTLMILLFLSIGFDFLIVYFEQIFQCSGKVSPFCGQTKSSLYVVISFYTLQVWKVVEIIAMICGFF